MVFFLGSAIHRHLLNFYLMCEGLREWVRVKCNFMSVYNSETIKIWNQKDIPTSLIWEMGTWDQKNKNKGLSSSFYRWKIERLSNLVSHGYNLQGIRIYIYASVTPMSLILATMLSQLVESTSTLSITVGRYSKKTLKAAIGKKEEEVDDDTVMVHPQA